MKLKPHGKKPFANLQKAFTTKTRTPIENALKVLVQVANSVVSYSNDLVELDKTYPDDYRIADLKRRYEVRLCHFISMVDILEEWYYSGEEKNDDFKQ